MYIYFFCLCNLLTLETVYVLTVSGNVSSDFEILQLLLSFHDLTYHNVSSLFRLIWTHSWRCHLRWKVWKPGVCASSLWSSSHSSFHAPIDVQALIVTLQCYPLFFGFFKNFLFGFWYSYMRLWFYCQTWPIEKLYCKSLDNFLFIEPFWKCGCTFLFCKIK